MGPLMYSLYRSTRPNICVEIGAGYTTFWLAKAAADAAKEAAVEIEADNSGTAPWTFWNSLVGRSCCSSHGSWDLLGGREMCGF